MVKKESVKKDSALVSYIFGIISIVMAFMLPLAGLAFGIIGLVQCKKEKNDLSKKAKKYNIIGIVLSAISFIIILLLNIYLATINAANLLSGLS